VESNKFNTIAADDRANSEEKPDGLCGGKIGGTAGGAGTVAGRCVKAISDPNRCLTNDPALTTCGNFACGKNNTQIRFSSVSRCRTSCSRDSHCAFTAHCEQGECVKGRPQTTDTCGNKDLDYCTPYACGKDIALEPSPGAKCRDSCETDGHCALFHECMNNKCVESLVFASKYQSPSAIKDECFSKGESWAMGHKPWKCLKVPINVGGDPNARVAYIPPMVAPAALTKEAAPCASHKQCKPYRCGERFVREKDIASDAVCQTACEKNSDCANGFTCFNARCMQTRTAGAFCQTGAQCASGNCVDNICCNSACDSPCQKCSDMGICGWVEPGTDYRNDCGRCSTCQAMNRTLTNGVYKMECRVEAYQKDSKGMCGHGWCTGSKTGHNGCECWNQDETGFWAGKQDDLGRVGKCNICKPGYHGKECKQVDHSYVPPTPKIAGQKNTQDSTPRRMERRPVQYPVRVLDYSSGMYPGSVLGLLGEPDATDKYYKAHERHMQNAWEPNQFFCDRQVQGVACENNEWQNAKQWVVLEYKEAVYLSDVWVYENYNPGGLLQIYIQPAPSGSQASSGGPAPITTVTADGTRVEVPPAKGRALNTDATIIRSPEETDALATDTNPITNTTANTNNDTFILVWSRNNGSFGQNPKSWTTKPDAPIAHPTQVTTFQGEEVLIEVKTKVIKVVFDMSVDKKQQIDTIAILGFSVASLNLTGQCPGVKNVSADAVGAPKSTGNTRELMCSGHGVCGTLGCECTGEFEGAACDRCKFGFTGDDCDVKVPIPDMKGMELSRIVMFEDLNDFDQTEVQLRWDIQEYTPRTSRVFSSRHFGVKFVSPLITLGQHTHVRCQAGFFIIDMPNQQDSGIEVIAAKRRTQFPQRDRTDEERIDDGARIIFIKHIPYQTGVNVMGAGKGDNSDQMDVTTMWDAPEISIEFEIWSPDIQAKPDLGDHRLTLTYFSVHSAFYPSQRGKENPDRGSLN
jgi:hypothetical protein